MLDSYKTKINYPLLFLCLILYLFLLIWVIVFKCADPKLLLSPGYSLDPISFGDSVSDYIVLDLKGRFLYQFDWAYLNAEKIITKVKDFFINVSIFLPLGILFAVIIKKHKILFSTLIGFLFSLVVELFQLFTGFGGFQFIDLFTNTLGTLLGVLIYKLLIKIIKIDKVNFAINISSTITTLIFIPCVIMAIMSYIKYIDVINFKLYYLF